ncbi:MAG: lipocalin-like domain-containing protein [Desulfomonilaceae bacterium]
MLSRAYEVSELSFPRDHGRHRDFRTEWWYLSGQLRSDTGTEWAYHFTIFRRALERWTDLVLVGLAITSRAIRNMALFKRALARMLENQNCRRIRVDGYVGHLTITNVAEQKYVFFERAGTSLFNIAGGRDDCLGVWVKGWELKERRGILHVAAERDDFGIDLELCPLKPPVLHGDQGLSIKGSEAGQASYHYSLASLLTTGVLKWRGKSHPVAGSSLMDREFGTAMLPTSVRGWDWFGLILDNNYEIMISLIKNADGSIDDTSSGTIVFPDGEWQCRTSEHFHVEAVEFWTSSATGARYPVQWTVEVGQMNLRLEIRALIKEHEVISATSTAIDYWEGPVCVAGSMRSERITGNGHVELVGYSQAAGGKF